MLNRLAKAAEEEVLSWVDLPDVVDWPEVVRAVLWEMREPSDAAIDGAIGVMAKLEKPPESAPVQAQLSFVRALAVTINSGLIDTILNEKSDG